MRDTFIGFLKRVGSLSSISTVAACFNLPPMRYRLYRFHGISSKRALGSLAFCTRALACAIMSSSFERLVIRDKISKIISKCVLRVIEVFRFMGFGVKSRLLGVVGFQGAKTRKNNT